MEKFHIYIKFPVNLEKYISCAEDGEKFTKDLQIMLDRADCEHGASIYFEDSNKESFLNDLNAILPLVNFTGTLDMEEVIGFLLHEASAENWENGPLHEIQNDKDPYYVLFNPASRNIEEDSPPVLKEIAERTVLIPDTSSQACLLLDLLGNTPTINPISIIRGHRNTIAQFIYIDVVISFKQLEAYFERKRNRRRYNHNDNRHIEGHNDYRPSKSPLIGGIGGKANAEQLLHSAIGDRHHGKILINFDIGNNAYIRYEDENFQNQYHGYHLVVARTRPPLRDQSAEDIISGRVKSILKYRRENP